MKLEQVCTRLRIPKKHWETKIDNIPNGLRWKPHLKEYIAKLERNIKRPCGLLMHGPNSVGKSATASIILKAAFVNGFTGLWIHSRDAIKYEIEKTPFDDEYTLFERACTVDLLVMDELIIFPDIKATELAMEMLVRRRTEQKKCTLITTNLRPDEIRNMFSSFFAVLLECMTQFPMEGHNFRKEIASRLK